MLLGGGSVNRKSFINKTTALSDESTVEGVRFESFIRSDNTYGENSKMETVQANSHVDRMAGKRRNQIHMSEDFDNSLDDFAEYM